MNRVAEVNRTCFACPSQWNVKLDDDRWLYVRYRSGWFSVTDWITVDGEMGEDLYGSQVGGGLDGFMEDEVMMYWLDKALEESHTKEMENE